MWCDWLTDSAFQLLTWIKTRGATASKNNTWGFKSPCCVEKIIQCHPKWESFKTFSLKMLNCFLTTWLPINIYVDILFRAYLRGKRTVIRMLGMFKILRWKEKSSQLYLCSCCGPGLLLPVVAFSRSAAYVCHRKVLENVQKKCSFNPSRNDISLYIVIKITKKGNEKNTSSTHSIYIIFTSDI